MTTLVFGRNSSVGKELENLLPEGNLSNDMVYLGSEVCDLCIPGHVYNALDLYRPDNVVLLSAKVGGIFDNVAHQYDFLTKNMVINSNVIDICRYLEVKNLLCLSSTCAYPDYFDPEFYPLKEKDIHGGMPTKTNLGYGYAKRIMQLQIELCNEQYKTSYSYLIPCNLYGQYSKYDDSAHFLGKLLRKIWEFNNGKIDKIDMAGGGSAKRQYLYTPDLAQVIRKWIENPELIMANVAPEENLRICDITQIALEVCNCAAKVEFLDEKMAGQIRKEVSSELLLSRGFISKFTPLRDGIQKTYESLCKKWQ